MDHCAVTDLNLQQSVANLEQTQKDPRALQVHHDDAGHSSMSGATHWWHCPQQCHSKLRGEKGGFWILFSQAGLFTFCLFLMLLILSGILFPLSPLCFGRSWYPIGGNQKTTWLIMLGGIDQSDPVPWPLSFQLTAVSNEASQERPQGRGF